MESRLNMSGLGPLYPTVTTSSRSPPKAWTTRISRKVELLLEPAAAPGKHSAATAGKSPANPHKHGTIRVALAARRPIQAALAARAASRCSMQKANFSSKSAFSARESAISPRVFSEYFRSIFRKGTKSDKISTFRTCYWGRQVSRDVFLAARAPREAAKQPEPVHSPAPNCAAGLSADRRVAAV